jgi:hypothetical protein
MAQSLGSLFVELKAETGAFVTGMSKASYAAKQASKDIGDGFSKMGNAVDGVLGQLGPFGAQLSSISGQVGNFFETFKVSGSSLGIAVAGIAAIGVAGIAAAAGIAALAIHGAELVERLSLISQKTGISIHDLQGFEAAGHTVGVSLEDMVTAMRKLDQGISGIGKGSAAAQIVLKGLGVTSHDNKEALLQLADAFQKMPDGAQKAADAIVVLGRSGLQMIPFLNMGREKIQEFNAMVDQYGPKIGVEAVKANEDFLMSQAKLNLIWQSLSVTAEQTFLPALAKIAGAIADLTKKTTDFWSAMKTETWTDIGKYWLNVASGKPSGTGMSVPVPTNSGNADVAKDAANKKIEDALKRQEDAYDRIKAGSAAVYALESKRAAIAVLVDAGKFKEAAALQSQIPALEEAVKLDKERTAEMKHWLEVQAHLDAAVAKQSAGGQTPLFSLGRPGALKAAAAGPAPDESGVPTGTADLGILFAKPVDKMAEAAKATIADLYTEWGVDARKTADDVNDTYDEEVKKIQGFWALGLISQKTADDASIELEKARYKALEAVWAKSDNFGDQFKAFFAGIADNGRDVAKSFFDDMKSSLDELNAQLAKFIVTGKGLNFKKLATGLETNLASTGIKGVESIGAGFLGGLFKTGGKKDGSSPGSALYVSVVPGVLGGGAGALAGANGVGPLPFTPQGMGNANAAFGGMGGFGAMFGGGGGGGGGIMSLFAKLGGMFGGFLSAGGDVTPGKTYVVGEDHPEFFSPKSAGKVAPSLKFSGHAPAPVIHFSVNGVSDFDSFKRSQQQIGSGLAQQLAIANSRNR